MQRFSDVSPMFHSIKSLKYQKFYKDMALECHVAQIMKRNVGAISKPYSLTDLNHMTLRISLQESYRDCNVGHIAIPI